MSVLLRCGLALALLFWASVANANVTSHGINGFVVANEVTVPGSPEDAYAAFIKIGSWWDAEHSFSGDTKNFTLDPQPGGCWCETLPQGGFVRHLEVIHANPGSKLVLSGGLGPLQAMAVAGTMFVTFKAEGVETKVTLTYSIGGYDPDNFAQIPAGVDGVLAAQLARYKNFVVSGKP